MLVVVDDRIIHVEDMGRVEKGPCLRLWMVDREQHGIVAKVFPKSKEHFGTVLAPDVVVLLDNPMVTSGIGGQPELLLTTNTLCRCAVLGSVLISLGSKLLWLCVCSVIDDDVVPRVYERVLAPDDIATARLNTCINLAGVITQVGDVKEVPTPSGPRHVRKVAIASNMAAGAPTVSLSLWQAEVDSVTQEDVGRHISLSHVRVDVYGGEKYLNFQFSSFMCVDRPTPAAGVH